MQGWEGTFAGEMDRKLIYAGEMGVERNFPGRKPTRWAYGRGRERKNPEMMCGECGLMTKWAQREAFRGENPRGGCIGKIGAGKAQVWLVYME